MMWRTHVFAGLNSLWLLAAVPSGVTTDNIALMAVIAGFGALLPDLDATESKVKHLSLYGIKPFLLPSLALHRSFGHRGLLHSLFGLVIFSLIALPIAIWWGWQPWAALVLGYGSHLAADACTRSGIPFFDVPPLYPDKRRYHLLPRRLRIVTGSRAEDVIFILLALAALLLFLNYLPIAGALTTN